MLDNAFLSVIGPSNDSSILSSILGIAVLIISISFSLFLEKFCILTLKMNGKGLLRVFQGKVTLFRFFLKLIIPCIAFSLLNSSSNSLSNSFVFVSLLTFTFILASLFDQLYNNIYDRLPLLHAYFAGLSISISLIIFSFF